MIPQEASERLNVLSLEEIQQESLNILRRFNAFCEENRLRYSLAGGSLLGAVRHQGFIPWDDDIDVMMPRPDYEKLRLLAPELRNDTGFDLRGFPDLLSEETPIMMLVNPIIKKKPFYRQSVLDFGMDILPVDGLPENEDEVVRIYRAGDKYRRILLAAQADDKRGKTRLNRMMKRAFKRIDKTLSLSKSVEKKLIRMAKRYNYADSKYVGIVTWGLYGPGERMLKEPFERIEELSFEGEKYPVISCWDAYLSGIYGDYMQIPPESERSGHNMFAWREDTACESGMKGNDEERI